MSDITTQLADLAADRSTLNELTAEILPYIIGKEYIETGSLPYEGKDRVKHKYRELAQINESLFESIPVEVIFTKEDPYASFAELRQEVDGGGPLRIFGEGTHPDYISKEMNIKGRAVHDYYGHYLNNVDFSFQGEVAKWHNMKSYYPESLHGILFAEVVGQVSAAYYLDDGFSSDRFTQRQFEPPTGWINAVNEVILND